jgi:hypothetical protein
LVAAAQSLLWSGLAINTRNTYGTGTRSYLTFTELYPTAIPTPFPASDTGVCMWLTHLHRSNLKFTTIRVYLCALKSHHTDLDLECTFPRSHLVQRLYRGIKRVQGVSGNIKPRFPMTFAVLRELDRTVFPSTLLATDAFARLVRAVMWVASAGLFRIGELVVENKSAKPNAIDRLLCVRDLKVAQLQPLVMSIHLRASKTDVFRHEVDVNIYNATALAALSTYLNARPTPLTPGSALFCTADGHPLTRKQLLSTAAALLQRAGINTSQYSGISFRRGGATSLSSAGIQDHMLKTLGRWLGWSYTRYIETPIQSMVDATRNL